MDNNNIGNPISSWFYRSGDNLLPLYTALEIGSSATRIAKGWFTNLDASSVVIGAVASGVVSLPNGTVSAPSLTFTSDTNTGIYRYGTDQIGLAAGGVVRGIINTTGFAITSSTNYSCTTNNSVLLLGQRSDGATAIGIKLGNVNSLATAGAKIVSFYSDEFSTEETYIDKDGFRGHPTSGAVTASTTQTQGQGAITAEIVNVSVCANANDTVTLPTAKAGIRCYIFNNGAQTLQIFPASGDNLGAGVDTAKTLAAGKQALFIAYDATNWQPVLGANLL